MGLWTILSYLGTGVSVVLTAITYYRQEKIKSSLKKSEFIHQKQFEKEFELYKEIWVIVIDISYILDDLNYPQITKEYQTIEEVKKENKRLAEEKGNKLLELMKNNRPFYDEAVYDSLTRLNMLLKNTLLYAYESKKDTMDDKRNNSFFEIATDTIKTYEILSNDLNLKIKERIQITSPNSLVATLKALLT